MGPVTIHPKDQKQWSALKIIFEAMNVPFENEEASPYNPEFVAKIKRSEEQVQKGKITRIQKENLEDFLGIK